MDEREAHSWMWSAAEDLLRREDTDSYHSAPECKSCGSVETKQCIQQNVIMFGGGGGGSEMTQQQQPTLKSTLHVDTNTL